MGFDVIIAGSRDFNDYDLLRKKCNLFFANKHPTSIISGGARGADSLGRKYASEKGIPCVVMPAQWDTYGKKAGYLRNNEMLKRADALVAFWDGSSPGTQQMIQISKHKGIPVRIVRFGCDTCNAKSQ